MNNTINIIPPRTYSLRGAKDPDIEREIQDIGLYVSRFDFVPEDGEIVFVPIRGSYSHIKRSMELVCVFVNNGAQSIFGLDATLKLTIKDVEAELAVIRLKAPYDFMGELNPRTGLLIHVNVPVRGLSEDRIFESASFDGGMSDIEVMKANDSED
jgi:hypothetical protein